MSESRDRVPDSESPAETDLLAEILFACLEAPEPEAELLRRTAARPGLRAHALRLLRRVLHEERAHGDAPRDGERGEL